METIQNKTIYNSCKNNCNNLKREREDEDECENRYKMMRKNLDEKKLFEVDDDKLAYFFRNLICIEKKEEPLKIEEYEDEEEMEDYETDYETDESKYRYSEYESDYYEYLSDEESEILNIISDEKVIESEEENNRMEE